MERKLLGMAEIAEELEAKPTTVAQWYRRGKLPPPTEILALGPVWSREDIGDFIEGNRGYSAGN